MNKKITGWFIVSLIIAGVLSLFASQNPDGFDRTAKDHGFASQATNVMVRILPDYTIPGVDSFLSTSLSGIIGTVLTFGIFLFIGKQMSKRG